MRRFAILTLALAATLTGCATLEPEARMASVLAAVADPTRPAADTVRDAARKPAETIVFAGIKPGDTVAEFLPGGGYYTRILSRAVGPSGRVYAIVSQAQASRPGGLDTIKAIAAAYPNVTVIPVNLTDFTLAGPVDLAWTTENYHDLQNGPTANPAGFLRSVRAALKPGGIFYVQDHSAPGTGLAATQTLHRIDPAAVISQVVAAGFRLDAQSNLLANPADPHTGKSTEGDIRGQTDKFALRFRKPG